MNCIFKNHTKLRINIVALILVISLFYQNILFANTCLIYQSALARDTQLDEDEFRREWGKRAGEDETGKNEYKRDLQEILFIHTSDIARSEVQPPLATAYLTAAVRNRFGPRLGINVIDMGLEPPEYDVRDSLLLQKPQVVCISIPSSFVLRDAVALASRTKELAPETIIIVGGVCASVDPEAVMAYKCFDILVKGEGEVPLVSLLEAFSAEGKIDNVKGIYYREQGELIFTGPGERMSLDELPANTLAELPIANYDLASRQMVPGTTELATQQFSGEPSLPILASQGCPYKCRFCSYPQTVSSGKVRFKSPENVVAELEANIKAYGIYNFTFYDDTFTLNRKRAEKICRLIIERRLPIRWRCMTRADKLDAKLLQLMRRAGCVYISMGLECADPDVLTAANKRMNLDSYRRIWQDAKKAGIRIRVFIMIGLPYQTMESIEKIIEFLREIQPDEIDVEYFVPYMGSEFCQHPDSWGLEILEPDRTRYRHRDPRGRTGEVRPVIQTKWMTKDEIIEAKRMITSYYEELVQQGGLWSPRGEGMVTVLETNSLATTMVIRRQGDQYYLRREASPRGEEAMRGEINWLMHHGGYDGTLGTWVTNYSLEPGNVFYETGHREPQIMAFRERIEIRSRTERVLSRYLAAKELNAEDTEFLISHYISNTKNMLADGASERSPNDILQTRLMQLRQADPKIRKLIAEGILFSEQPLHYIWEVVLPYSEWIAGEIELRRTGQDEGALVLGLTGEQGLGKTTLSLAASVFLEQNGYCSASVSIDDFYKTHDEREALRAEEPRYKYRGGAFGAHDTLLAETTLLLLKHKDEREAVSIPKFDKSLKEGSGDRLPRGQWPIVEGKIDVIFFEGCGIGSEPVAADELSRPINHLERSAGSDEEEIRFRQRSNSELGSYQQLFSLVDKLVVMHTPNLGNSYRWRQMQEDRLLARSGTAMSPATVRDYVDYCLPTVQRYVYPLGERSIDKADLVFTFGNDHRLASVFLKDNSKNEPARNPRAAIGSSV